MPVSVILPILAVVITNVADLRKAVWSNLHAGDSFSTTCMVTAVLSANKSYCVKDATGYCYMRTTNNALPKAGMIVHINGHIGIDQYNWQRAFADSAVELGKGTPPAPITITAEQLNDESFDDHTVLMRGIVTDIIHDEIDPNWRFLALRSEFGPFLAAISMDKNQTLNHLVGATISAKGIANVLPDGGKRKFKTAQLTISAPEDISIEIPAPKDPFETPPIPHTSGAENFRYKSAALISRMGCRSAKGVVIAIFDRQRKLLIKTKHGQLIGAELNDGTIPLYGESVTIAGFPETDLFILKLTRAACKRNHATATIMPEQATKLSGSIDMDVVLRELLGRTVRITGKVSGQTDESAGRHGLFSLTCGTHQIPVDVSALHEDASRIAPSESLVEVTGICVFNTGSWSPLDILPRIDGFTIVPRTKADIIVVEPPPWWTARRLLAVIVVLLGALMAVLIWNRILNKLIERRGRQLFKTEVAKAESDLRVDERTRLAVELHDSIAQTLTGVSFQIDAAEKNMHVNAETAVSFLNVARKTLLSCREELRRCLWDLRSQALEEPDFQDAIRKTIQPHVEGVKATIRFNVSRSHLSDTTAHNILNIIRELCANAVRHGKARHIRIDGENKDGILRFSVKDDGSGFDISNHPDASQGHFGLQGIKERLRRMHGTLDIASAAEKGTQVTVEIGK